MQKLNIHKCTELDTLGNIQGTFKSYDMTDLDIRVVACLTPTGSFEGKKFILRCVFHRVILTMILVFFEAAATVSGRKC